MQIQLLTPTYAPDLDRFRMLRASLDAFGCKWPHLVAVQTEHMPLFAARSWGPEVTLVATADLLSPALEKLRRRVAGYPNWFRDLRRLSNERFGWFADASRDGWNMQQIIKLQIASTQQADCWVTLDSDVLITGAPRSTDFVRGERVAVHAQPAAEFETFDASWNLAARALLGAAPPPVEMNYVAHPFSFRSDLVRRLLAAVESRHGRSWTEVFGGLRASSLSEFSLYGSYVEQHAAALGEQLFPMPANARTRWVHKRDPARAQETAEIISSSLADPEIDYLVLQAHGKYPIGPYVDRIRALLDEAAAKQA